MGAYHWIMKTNINQTSTLVNMIKGEVCVIKEFELVWDIFEYFPKNNA